MTKYETNFLAGLSDKERTEYRELIKARKAYLEREGDGSEVLIVLKAGGCGEDMFARLPDTQEATRIGTRARRSRAGKTTSFRLLMAAWWGIGGKKQA